MEKKAKKEVEKVLMKNRLLTAVLFALSVLPISCGNGGHIQQYYQSHVGVWEDADFTGSKAIVVLRENGTGTILFDRQLSDFKYVMDYSKKPTWLDLIYAREGKPYRTKAIVKFLDINRLKWRTFFGETRPAKFLLEDDKSTAILNRFYPMV